MQIFFAQKIAFDTQFNRDSPVRRFPNHHPPFVTAAFAREIPKRPCCRAIALRQRSPDFVGSFGFHSYDHLVKHLAFRSPRYWEQSVTHVLSELCWPHHNSSGRLNAVQLAEEQRVALKVTIQTEHLSRRQVRKATQHPRKNATASLASELYRSYCRANEANHSICLSPEAIHSITRPDISLQPYCQFIILEP